MKTILFFWADEFNGNQKNTDSNGLDVDNWGYELDVFVVLNSNTM